ncbi:hypothetical protein [Terribacillus sp. JSM ZJ617]|uniref:hypothetical protein n=1 Tax=Terribacillus sp. JSM ZJ617 TaxID=3342119 RepID=UPI0035A8640A
MKISVNEKTQRFYLAANEWVPMVGHEIKVGKYKFFAIPGSTAIRISEVESGCKLFDIPMSMSVMAQTSTKEDALNYLLEVGASLERIIKKRPKFDVELKKVKQIAFDKLGERPPIEDVDTNWIFEEESARKH